MDNKDRKILILGAGEGQVPLIARAKKEGWYVIVVSPAGNYPGFAIADTCRFYDISDKDAILQLATEEKISAIATDQTDISIPTVLFVSQRLGLPRIDCLNIDNFRIKSSMRDACRNIGISHIPYCVTNSLKDTLWFYKSLPDGKAIVKPIDSQGSRGVQRVSSSEEIEEGYYEALQYSHSNQIIIERFIEGHEIEVDTVIRDGKIRCALIGDVYNFALKNTFSAYIREYPTVLSKSAQVKILELNSKVIDAFGLRTGWTHGEYIYTPDKEVYLIEIGARGGGGFIGSDIVRTMLGVSTDEMAFRTAIGDYSFYDEVYLHDAFCAYRCFYLPEGEIVSISISDAFLHQPFVLTHNLDRLHIGQITHKNTDKTSRFVIVIKADTRSVLKQRLLEVEQSIDIRVKTVDGIKGIIWK